jgi:zinc protease
VHPYHTDTIGDLCDLQNMTRDDLWERYQAYYRPNNAIAVLVGDVQSKQAMERLQAHFGGLEAGPALEQSVRRPEPEQRGERRDTREGSGGAAHLEVAYHAPPSTSDEFMAMTVMNAVLTGPAPMSSSGGGGTNRSSRLYQALVETELASSVGGSLMPTRDPYLYDLAATVRTGRTLPEVEEALTCELSAIAEAPIAESELAKAIKQSRAQFAYAAEESINQAYWLGHAELLDSYTWFESYVDRLSAVTAEDVQRAASRYLKPANRTVGWYVPA